MAGRGRPSRTGTPAPTQAAGVRAARAGEDLAALPRRDGFGDFEDLEPPEPDGPSGRGSRGTSPWTGMRPRKRMPVRRQPPRTGRSPTGKKVPEHRFLSPLGKARRPSTGNAAFDSAIMSLAAHLREAQYGVSGFLTAYRELHLARSGLERWSARAARGAGKATHKGTARRLDRLSDQFADAAERMAMAYRKTEQSQDDLEYLIDGGIAVVRRLMESQDRAAVQQAKRLSGQIDVVERALDQPGQHLAGALATVRAIRNVQDLSPKKAIDAAAKAADRLDRTMSAVYEMLEMLDDAADEMVEALEETAAAKKKSPKRKFEDALFSSKDPWRFMLDKAGTAGVLGEGNFATVWKHPHSRDEVVKVSRPRTRSDCWLQFAEALLSDRPGKHLPSVRRIAKHDGGRSYTAIMERLEKLYGSGESEKAARHGRNLAWVWGKTAYNESLHGVTSDTTVDFAPHVAAAAREAGWTATASLADAVAAGERLVDAGANLGLEPEYPNDITVVSMQDVSAEMEDAEGSGGEFFRTVQRIDRVPGCRGDIHWGNLMIRPANGDLVFSDPLIKA